MAVDRLTLYDALYGLAADEGREQALFGSCAPLAHEAFKRSLAQDGFPIIWFELPLAGEPRFDLHVALSRKQLQAGTLFRAGAGNGYDELLRWYADEEPGGNGLAFAYDISEGRIEHPAIHINVNKVPLSNMDRFFDLATDSGAAHLYAGFARRLPPGWDVWYVGVHPGRPGSPIRVDCFVSSALKAAYAADVALLERDLHACGFSATGPALHELVAPILASPYRLELQFDVMRDGKPGPTLGVSAAFTERAAQAVQQAFGEGGPAATLMSAVESLGLCDARWHHVPDATFTKLISVDGTPLALYCMPTFVKLRMRDGTPLDAKFYLQASAVVL